MVKLIGMLLIITSLLSLIAGTIIDIKYSKSPHITGNVVSNLFAQQPSPMHVFDYLEAAAFSYSIVSFLMGLIFLFRV